jgi:hypothetical protein
MRRPLKMSVPPGSRAYGRFDELAEEFAERYRRGERPSVEDYVDRLPEMADEIRELFSALVEVEQVEGDVRDDAHRPHPPARASGISAIIESCARSGGAAWGSFMRPSRSRWAAGWP